LTVRRKPKKKKKEEPKEEPKKEEKKKPSTKKEEVKKEEPKKEVKKEAPPKAEKVTKKEVKPEVKKAEEVKKEAPKAPEKIPEKVPAKEAPPKAEPSDISSKPGATKPSTAVKITTGAAITAAGAFSSAESFAQTMAPEAEKASKSLGGVPANALLGQWALESGWGKSVSGDFNYFGIKAQPGYSGDKKLVTTREVFTDAQAKAFVSGMPGREIVSQSGNKYVVKDWFRSYKSIGEAVEDKVNFLKSNKRYAAAGVFDAKTPEQYFSALQKAGYATDPNYVSSGVAMASSVDKKLKKLAPMPITSPTSTGTKIDQSSKENKDMKDAAANTKKQQTVNNTTVNQTNTQSSSSSDNSEFDDRNAQQKKKG
jgi:flagellum-specific peptidoglycan hydrolase FlgJ